MLYKSAFSLKSYAVALYVLILNTLANAMGEYHGLSDPCAHTAHYMWMEKYKVNHIDSMENMDNIQFPITSEVE